MSRYRWLTPLSNQRCRRPLDRQSLLQWTLVCLGGVVLAMGFGLAAWQQLEALRMSYEAHRLRGELEELIRERQQLETERQQKLSPMHIERLGRPYRFVRPQAGQTIVLEARP